MYRFFSLYFFRKWDIVNVKIILFFIAPLQQFFLIIICFSSSSINAKRNSEVWSTFFTCVWFFHHIMNWFNVLRLCFIKIWKLILSPCLFYIFIYLINYFFVNKMTFTKKVYFFLCSRFFATIRTKVKY